MAQLLMVNPKRRTTKRKKTAAKRRTSLPAKKTPSFLGAVRRKYRRNPLPANRAIEQFKDGAIGAAGALAVDVAMQKLPIPANLKTGMMAPVVQGFVGIGLGMAIAKFGKNRRLGQQMAQGAVTVSLYNAGRKMLAPTLGLAGYDDQGVLGFDDQGVLGYESTDFGDGVGWYSPAQVSEPYEMSGFDDIED